MSHSQPSRKTPLIAIILAWTIVALPLAWGLTQSVIKSKPLFSGTAAAATPSASASSASVPGH
jgi:hypothetical protein